MTLTISKSLKIIATALIISGCATQQSVSLLPRSPATEQGVGILNRLNQDLTVTVSGNIYRGKSSLQTGTSTTGFGMWTRTSTHFSNQSTALLLGDNGQMRCEYGWDSLMIEATGVCVDSRNVTYDIIIKNP